MTLTAPLVFSYLVVVIATVTLIHAALFDLKHFTIRNSLVLFLVLLYLLHAALTWRWARCRWTWPWR